jgi:hypothetical protein
MDEIRQGRQKILSSHRNSKWTRVQGRSFLSRIRNSSSFMALLLPRLTGSSQSYSSVAYYVGLTLGASFWGLSSDLIGRKPAFNCTLFYPWNFSSVPWQARWILLHSVLFGLLLALQLGATCPLTRWYSWKNCRWCNYWNVQGMDNLYIATLSEMCISIWMTMLGNEIHTLHIPLFSTFKGTLIKEPSGATNDAHR